MYRKKKAQTCLHPGNADRVKAKRTDTLRAGEPVAGYEIVNPLRPDPYRDAT